ncbi:MAG: tripartite tricarboxylate transporter TctB family protein [Granulosicoccus sp.]|nr:tripartite tricarboxylate transporter TctB family protein [Granulosicoccus sp.]
MAGPLASPGRLSIKPTSTPVLQTLVEPVVSMPVNTSNADRITGAVLLVLGIAMLLGGYNMERLEIRQIHPASIPGLVPMILGAAMIICSLLLIATASKRSTEQVQADTDDAADSSVSNLLVTVILSLGYGAGLLGKLPYLPATALYIFLFSLYFSWAQYGTSRASRIRLIALTAVFAVSFAAGIAVLFQYGFLVRLP